MTNSTKTFTVIGMNKELLDIPYDDMTKEQKEEYKKYLDKFIRIGTSYYNIDEYSDEEFDEILDAHFKRENEKLKGHYKALEQYIQLEKKKKKIIAQEEAKAEIEWLMKLLKGEIHSYEYDTTEKIVEAIEKEMEVLNE